jgi:hypothetical protein
MMRNPNLALSAADAGMSRLMTLCAYKADRGATDREDRSVVPVHSGLFSRRMRQFRHEEHQSTRMHLRRLRGSRRSGSQCSPQRLLVRRGTSEPGLRRHYARGDRRAGARLRVARCRSQLFPQQAEVNCGASDMTLPSPDRAARNLCTGLQAPFSRAAASRAGNVLWGA